MSDSDNESNYTYYSSSSSSYRSNDEGEMDFLEYDDYDEYYDEIQPSEKMNTIEEPKVETQFFHQVDTKVPAVNPWKKQEETMTPLEEKPKSFLEILKEETEKSKLEKIELEKKKEFEKKYKNRPNFNFINTYNSRSRLSRPSNSNKKHVSLLKPLKSKS